MRILELLTDAYGGIGGIAQYNRDFLTALCSYPDCTEVVALPRIMPREPEPMPEKLTYRTGALRGKLRYITTFLWVIAKDRKFDLIVCGHINLLPLAFLAKKLVKAPLILVIYGIDAWRPTRSRLTNRLVKNIDAFLSISQITKRRFLSWTGIDEDRGYLLPNAIHLEKYGPGPKNPELVARHGLEGKKVLMTLGRLVSHERAKGFDEILDALPELALEIPEIVYLICGGGNDRRRLGEKARTLGIAERVVFAGYIPEHEKPDYYRLADLYVMPSRGEGFGFVFLEALACGVPTIGSKFDGGREALGDGIFGKLVDPDNQEALKKTILESLFKANRLVPDGLSYFSFPNFEKRVWQNISSIRKLAIRDSISL